MNILIITYDWPPRNTIAVHRPFAWAKYWHEMGARVVVLTAKKCSYDEPLDLQLNIPEGIEVIEIPYRKEGTTQVDNSFISNFRKKIIFLLKKNSSLIRKLFNSNFDIRDRWSSAATSEAIDLCKQRQINIVVSTYGPRACHFIASNIKTAIPHIRWVADYRDLWSISHLSDMSNSMRNKEKYLEKSTLKTADLLTTVSEPLAKDLSSFLNKEVHVICNGFDALWENVEKNISEPKVLSLHKPLKIIYTGSIYPGHRNPSPLFHAINELIKRDVINSNDIQVKFFGHRQPELINFITELSADKYAHVCGHISRDSALHEQRDADVLLLLESGSPDAKGVLTGKVFEYIASGKPVLSLGSKHDSAIGQLLLETGVGITCEDDVKKIELVLEDFIKSQKCGFYKPKVDEIKKFSRKTQSTELFSLIKSIDRK